MEILVLNQAPERHAVIESDTCYARSVSSTVSLDVQIEATFSKVPPRSPSLSSAQRFTEKLMLAGCQRGLRSSQDRFDCAL